MAIIVLVAHDLSPSNGFERIATQFRAGPVLHLGKGGKQVTNLDNMRPEAFQDASFVLVGMSSPAENARHELWALSQCRRFGTPYGIYSDTYGAWVRKWFEPFRSACSLLLVTSPAERQEARRLFPRASIVACGNPMWEEYFTPAPAEAPQDMSRSSGGLVVLAPGTKAPEVNRVLWRAIIDAAPRERSMTLLAIPHPGSSAPVSAYDDLVAMANENGIVMSTTPKGKSDEYVPFVDAIVGLNAGGSVPIHGICRRKPLAVYVGNPAISEWRKTNVGDARIAEESGAAIMVASAKDLAAFLVQPPHPLRTSKRLSCLVLSQVRLRQSLAKRFHASSTVEQVA